MKILVFLLLAACAVATKHRIILEDVTEEYATHVAETHGFSKPSLIVHGRNDWVLEHDGQMRAEAISEDIAFREDIEVQRFTRDRLWKDAWHLTGSESMFSNTSIHLGVQDAWDMGIDGTGVFLTVIDDGAYPSHPDFSNHYEAHSYNFNTNSHDPSPLSRRSMHHGQAALSVAAGAMDGNACAAGVAKNAHASMVNLLESYMTASQEARAFGMGLLDHEHPTDIFSCSWGPSDDGRLLGFLPLDTERALLSAITFGRSGKGAILVWAGGNGRRSQDMSNYDGFANFYGAFAVGAIGPSGYASWYSERGANLLVSVGSSDYSNGINRGIVGASPTEYDAAGCTRGFGGTSAAAPQVAGLAALAIQANPALTWRDVRDVLIKAARGSRAEVNLLNVGWVLNSAGYEHNLDYGFGLPKAKYVVEFSRNHTNLPQMHEFNKFIPGSEKTIEKNSLQTFSVNIDPYQVGECEIVENVRLRIDARISNGLKNVNTIILTSPAGTRSILLEPNRLTNSDVRWTFSSLVTYGELSHGIWTVAIQTLGEKLEIRGMELRIQGHKSE